MAVPAAPVAPVAPVPPAAPAAPLPGDLYPLPPLPVDLLADVVANILPPAVLATARTVTDGPDRNIFYVYNHMPT
jgi:hypothetical protein